MACGRFIKRFIQRTALKEQHSKNSNGLSPAGLIRKACKKAYKLSPISLTHAAQHHLILVWSWRLVLLPPHNPDAQSLNSKVLVAQVHFDR